MVSFKGSDQFIKETLFLDYKYFLHFRLSNDSIASGYGYDVQLRLLLTRQESAISTHTCVSKHDASIGGYYAEHVLADGGNVVVGVRLMEKVQVVADELDVLIECTVVVVVVLQLVVQVSLGDGLALPDVADDNGHYFQESSKLSESGRVEDKLLFDGERIGHGIGIELFVEGEEWKDGAVLTNCLFRRLQQPLKQGEEGQSGGWSGG